LDRFIFYFEAGAGLVSPAASQKLMQGFIFVWGCEFGPPTSPDASKDGKLEGKPAIRVVSCAPRKQNQAKNDAHHAVEFGFEDEAQKEMFVAALQAARLPKADADVAAMLASLDK
jgi:hypothetical protein